MINNVVLAVMRSFCDVLNMISLKFLKTPIPYLNNNNNNNNYYYYYYYYYYLLRPSFRFKNFIPGRTMISDVTDVWEAVFILLWVTNFRKWLDSFIVNHSYDTDIIASWRKNWKWFQQYLKNVSKNWVKLKGIRK